MGSMISCINAISNPELNVETIQYQTANVLAVVFIPQPI